MKPVTLTAFLMNVFSTWFSIISVKVYYLTHDFTHPFFRKGIETFYSLLLKLAFLFRKFLDSLHLILRNSKPQILTFFMLLTCGHLSWRMELGHSKEVIGF